MSLNGLMTAGTPPRLSLPIKIGSRVRYSAKGYKTFSRACKGMASAGVVIAMRPVIVNYWTQGTRDQHMAALDDFAVCVLRDGQQRARWFNASYWERIP